MAFSTPFCLNEELAVRDVSLDVSLDVRLDVSLDVSLGGVSSQRRSRFERATQSLATFVRSHLSLC